MGSVVYSMGVSLDGYMEGPNHELDWHIVDEELLSYVMAQQREVGVYLWGRRVYENMAAYWSTADQDPEASSFVIEYARIWRNTPKIVFSRTLEHVDPRGNARLVREVTPEAVASWKTEFGKVLSVACRLPINAQMRRVVIPELG